MLIIVGYWESMSTKSKEAPCFNKYPVMNQTTIFQLRISKNNCTWKVNVQIRNQKTIWNKEDSNMKKNVLKLFIKLNR